MEKWSRVVLFPGVVAIIAFSPWLHLVFVTVNLSVSFFILGLQALVVSLPRIIPKRLPITLEQSFVSIHVPAHNEPPELLKETLVALSKLEWSNYEVLVIDNNTTDPLLWEPIAKFCEQLGPKFRFFHVENMTGFKAGAMNYLQQFMDERTSFVFVVDADYIVAPDAIQRGLCYFSDTKVGMVQFPQDYRNICSGNRGVTLDFKHFFSAYMNMANRLDCVPSTGTLSFLRLEALKAVNGFGTQVITEDADLGLRLALQDYRSVYAHEMLGQGVMPHDLPSLKKQRWRWAFGNAQILKLNGGTLFTSPKLTLKQKLGFLAHLTAWFNFNLIPTFSLLLVVPLILTGKMSPEHPYIVTLSAFTLVLWLILRFMVFFYGLRRDGHSFKEIAEGFITHVGLGWIYSSSWMKCLIDHRSIFVRTNKFLSRNVPDALRATLPETLVGLALAGAFVQFLIEGFLIAPIAAFLIGATRFSIHWVARQMRSTLELSLIQEGEKKTTDLVDQASPFPMESNPM